MAGLQIPPDKRNIFFEMYYDLIFYCNFTYKFVYMSKEKDLITINVMGTNHKVEKNQELSYDQIIAMVYSTQEEQQRNYTVSFERGHAEKPEGFITKNGNTVKAKDGMKFFVDLTGES